MAKFQSVNVDEIARELQRLGQVTSPMAREMVAQGAQVLVTTWKSVIRELRHEDSGDMLESVRADEPTQSGGQTVSETYPRGVDKKGVRNAEKAFLLHYGWKAGKPARGKKNSKGRIGAYKGDHFVDTVEAECAETVPYVMEAVMNQYTEGD